MRWKDSPDTEDSWIPLSDIPTSADELIERFHRRHTRAPRPHRLLIDRVVPIPPLEAVPSAADIASAPQVPPPVHPVVPAAAPRPPSPRPEPQNLRQVYEPPTRTTTRSGRVSRPPQRYDPL